MRDAKYRGTSRINPVKYCEAVISLKTKLFNRVNEGEKVSNK